MMRNDLPILTKYLVAAVHPVIMILVIVGTFYAAYFGIQIRRSRNAEKETKKEMMKAKYNQKHFQIASTLLHLWISGSILGMAATYYLFGLWTKFNDYSTQNRNIKRLNLSLRFS